MKPAETAKPKTGIVTAAQAAKMLGVSKRQVTDLCNEGAFPGAYRTSKSPLAHWRIPLADIEAFKHGA